MTTLDANGRVWFEEYASDRTTPPLVINGLAFAIFGMYDYFQITQDPRARILMDAGATTYRDSHPEYRNPGGISYYCAENPHCQHYRWARSVHYHEVVVDQLKVLSQMTADSGFSAIAAQFLRDYPV